MATIGTHYILSALGGARKRGADCNELLQKARIPEKRLKDPKARFHVDLVAKLYDGIADALNDEFMGFTEHPLKVGTFELMAEWVSRSHNLEEMLRKGIRFYNQITDEINMSLEIAGDHVYFTSTFRRPELDFEHFFIEYWHVIWHRFASWYIGRPIKLMKVYINYEPLDREEFGFLFRCQTHYRSRVNRLVFHKSYLQAKLVKTQRDLELFLLRAPIDFLTIPGEDTSLSARIHQEIEPKVFDDKTVLALPNSSDLAAKLGLSEQSIRRNLSAEGISYQQIKDNLRQDLALKQLAKPNLSIAHISNQLGFSEPRAFTRAFKSWTGSTPLQYRNRQQD